MEKLSIKQLRMVRGLTQEQMAERVGVHRNTYASLEENPEKISIGLAKRIAAALEVSPNGIFFEN